LFLRALGILDRQFGERPFITGPQYTIADISIFAYAHRAPEAGFSLSGYPHFSAWVDRVRAQPGFLDEIHPYSIDPHAGKELP
jgi:glutathione S-transferase